MVYFTGDICLCDKAFDIGFGAGSMIAQGKIKPFSHLEKKEGDVWVGNFEGVVSDVTCRENYTRDSFRIGTDTFGKCDSIIDYWGIANNHVMEHGGEAYLQMAEFLGIQSKGVFGSNERRTVCFEHQGKIVAVTGFSLRAEEEKHKPLYWNLPELSDIREECERFADADYRVAYIHWGVEYVTRPSVGQVRLAHWLVDTGYDLVVGMHPHVLQGYEVYKGKYIFYSLGNTIFNMNYSPCRYGAIVNFDPETAEVSYKYIYINDMFCPEYSEEVNVPERLRFKTLYQTVGKEQNIEKYITSFNSGLKAYRKSNNREIIRNIGKFQPKVFVQIFTGFIKRRMK